MCNQTNDVIHVYFSPHRLPRLQNNPNSGTRASQHFLFIDTRRKIKSGQTRFVDCGPPSAQPPAAALCAAARHPAPLRGAIFCPSGALRALRAARAAFLETRKKCRVLYGPRAPAAGRRVRARAYRDTTTRIKNTVIYICSSAVTGGTRGRGGGLTSFCDTGRSARSVAMPTKPAAGRRLQRAHPRFVLLRTNT